MLDIKFIRDNAELIKRNVNNRGAKVDIDELLRLDAARRELETTLDNLRAKRNRASKTKPTPDIIAEMKKIGEKIKRGEEKLADLTPKYKELLYAVPNLTHPDVRISADEDEEDNPVLETYGKPTKFKFAPLDHVQLAQNLDLIDFDRGAKLAAPNFII